MFHLLQLIQVGCACERDGILSLEEKEEKQRRAQKFGDSFLWDRSWYLFSAQTAVGSLTRSLQRLHYFLIVFYQYF